jgi:hypothetical protein
MLSGSSLDNTLRYVGYWDDFPVYPLNNSWDDTVTAGFSSDKVYVVQTNAKVIERCLLMATGSGDLVLDPTCGSGTTAHAAEEAWATLNSDTARPFDKPRSGRIAVKVINHLGDEVMKVFRVD